jgi:uncharacterized damage-inducible protein DinB
MSLPPFAISNDAEPLVRSLMRTFQEFHRRFWELDGLNAAQVDWRPFEGFDSIGMILDHVVECELFFVQKRLLESTEEEWPQVEDIRRYGRMDQKRPGLPAESYLEKMAVPYTQCMEYLSRLSDEQAVQIEWIITHLCEHSAYHRGQIYYITMLPGFPEGGWRAWGDS